MIISSVAFLAAASSSCLLRSCLSFLSFSTWSLLFFGILRCGEKYYIVCDKLPIIPSIVIILGVNCVKAVHMETSGGSKTGRKWLSFPSSARIPKLDQHTRYPGRVGRLGNKTMQNYFAHLPAAWCAVQFVIQAEKEEVIATSIRPISGLPYTFTRKPTYHNT